MRNFVLYVALVFSIFIPDDVLSAKDKELYCGACKAVMDEVKHAINKVDPKKMIDVGGYRINAEGKSRTVKKSYARSESHLTEVLESVCKDVSGDYVVSTHPKTGEKIVSRMITHDGKMSSEIDFNRLMKDSQSQNADTPPDAKSKKIQFACESLVEDFEDEIIEHFSNEDSGDSSKICYDVAKYCEKADQKEEL